MIKITEENKPRQNKYENLADKTPRSVIHPQDPNEGNMLKIVNDDKNGEEDLQKVKEKEEAEELKKYTKSQMILQGRPAYLEVKPYVLQSPELQLYGQINNFAVCPFCKYTGSMEITYQRSSYQSKCCALMAIVGLCLCCWIPLIIRGLSDQVYKCSNCKKVLKIIPHNEA
jgi:hypothetical protein